MGERLVVGMAERKACCLVEKMVWMKVVVKAEKMIGIVTGKQIGRAHV